MTNIAMVALLAVSLHVDSGSAVKEVPLAVKQDIYRQITELGREPVFLSHSAWGRQYDQLGHRLPESQDELNVWLTISSGVVTVESLQVFPYDHGVMRAQGHPMISKAFPLKELGDRTARLMRWVQAVRSAEAMMEHASLDKIRTSEKISKAMEELKKAYEEMQP